jgi:hypothetical protein
MYCRYDQHPSLSFSRSISILAMPRRHLHPCHHCHPTLLPAYTQPWVKALPQHSIKDSLNPYPSKLFAVLYKYISWPIAGCRYQQLAAAPVTLGVSTNWNVSLGLIMGIVARALLEAKESVYCVRDCLCLLLTGRVGGGGGCRSYIIIFTVDFGLDHCINISSHFDYFVWLGCSVSIAS